MTAVTVRNMSNLIESYAQYLSVERMRSPSTAKRYLRVVREFAEYLADGHSGDEPLEAVDKSHLAQFLQRKARQSDEPSKSSWNTRLAGLRSFYDYLFKQELIQMNPALKVERLRVNGREPIPLSFDEMIRLVDAAKRSPDSVRTRNVAIVQVLFHCAFRVAELVSLDNDQVDFDNYLFLNVRTKGDKRLSAPFNDVVAEALERYLRCRKRFNPPRREKALFISERRQRLSIRSVQEMVKKYAKIANISRTVTPHLLRHSSATQLVAMGTPLRVVQEICGHASVTTTERYVHVVSGQRKEAIDALGKMWQQKEREKREET